jgi:predicted small metal-binding protein
LTNTIPVEKVQEVYDTLQDHAKTRHPVITSINIYFVLTPPSTAS